MNVIIVGCGNIGFEVTKILVRNNSLLLVDCCPHEYLTDFLNSEKNITFAQCDATDISVISRMFDQFCKKSGGIDER